MRVRTRQRCTAHKTNGQPCKQWAIHGARVCRSHGGAAPQVKRAAEERIRALVNPALDLITDYLEPPEVDEEGALLGQDVPPNVRLMAARDILDRAGYVAVQKVDARIRNAHTVEIADLDDRILRLLGGRRLADVDPEGEGPSGVVAGGEAEPEDAPR